MQWVRMIQKRNWLQVAANLAYNVVLNVILLVRLRLPINLSPLQSSTPASIFILSRNILIFYFIFYFGLLQSTSQYNNAFRCKKLKLMRMATS